MGYAEGQGRVLFSYAHPIFWAPFTLVGDGGGQGRRPDGAIGSDVKHTKT